MKEEIMTTIRDETDNVAASLSCYEQFPWYKLYL